jgi:hypothetical protein
MQDYYSRHLLQEKPNDSGADKSMLHLLLSIQPPKSSNTATQKHHSSSSTPPAPPSPFLFPDAIVFGVVALVVIGLFMIMVSWLLSRKFHQDMEGEMHKNIQLLHEQQQQQQAPLHQECTSSGEGGGRWRCHC